MGVGRERVRERRSGRGERERRGRGNGEEGVREGREGGLQHDECPKMAPDLQVVPDSPHDFPCPKGSAPNYHQQHQILITRSRVTCDTGTQITKEYHDGEWRT